VNDWLESARKALAMEAGLDESELELSAAEQAELLELARIAAHESGDRRNAPLLSYLVGVASRSGVAVEQLAAAVRRSSS
jgi:uncharacterized protein DUF6457